jgi:hypothetical protein
MSQNTLRLHNGKPMGFSVAESGDCALGDQRNLSSSVNRACSKWLEKELGYKPSFGGMRYGQPGFGKPKKK